MEVAKANVAQGLHGSRVLLGKDIGASTCRARAMSVWACAVLTIVPWQITDDDGTEHLSVGYKFGTCVVSLVLDTM